MKTATAPTEFTIDELARVAGTTVRNVRAYQERGLLPPPEKRGRVGIYGKVHLNRLKLIGPLLERGYSLANVAELISTWESGHDISKLLGLEAAITSPWSNEPPALIPQAQFLEMFGQALTPEAMARAIETGVVRMQGDAVHVSSIKLVQAGALLAAEGVPLEELLVIVAELRAESERIAGELMVLTTKYIFDRYGKDALPPASEVPRLAELIWRLRPMVLQIVDAEVARALERASDKHLGEKLSKIIEQIRTKDGG
ncbi:MAG TPA: MerR family transcriptional regulator [Rhizomicrobium sp.]|nr:MerR family transcriptional regulator [Rhizomicrobium sp.]